MSTRTSSEGGGESPSQEKSWEEKSCSLANWNIPILFFKANKFTSGENITTPLLHILIILGGIMDPMARGGVIRIGRMSLFSRPLLFIRIDGHRPPEHAALTGGEG